MKKHIKDDDLATLIQIFIKVDKKHDIPIMQIIHNAIGMNDAWNMSNEQLLEQLEQFYAQELKRH